MRKNHQLSSQGNIKKTEPEDNQPLKKFFSHNLPVSLKTWLYDLHITTFLMYLIFFNLVLNIKQERLMLTIGGN